MLRIFGSARRLCDSMTRRDLLRVGSWWTLAGALAGISAPKSPAATTPDVATHFGQARRIILLYLYGAAPQHELYDPKPEAPLEIRGKFRPISTAVPGVQICEHLPRIAQMADRVTFIRSMTHPYNIHSAAYTLTGIDKVDIPMELSPYDTRHWPFFGSVLDYLALRQNPATGVPEIPRNLAMPFQFSSRCAEFDRGGPYGGFLGRPFDPVWTEFEGVSTRSVERWRGNEDRTVADPYLGIRPDSRFVVSKAAQLRPEITLDRFHRRRSLLEQLEDGRRELDRKASAGGLDRFQEMAYSLITSKALRDALDVSAEPRERRERYGMTLFGQAALAGRRLLEAGAAVVSVFWDEIETANSAWDTHFNHFERLERELLPGLDQALSALLLDLEERSMLDDTLVMCLTEHGRTPQLHEKPRGVGREHWSNVYCNLLAGGGISRGKVVGSSDRDGAFVKDDPVSPKDVLTTMYHLMGVDPHTTIPDRLNRPLPLVSSGKVLQQMLG